MSLNIASAHLSNAPITVTLSTGVSIDVFPTSLSVLSDVTAQEDVALFAHNQYRVFQKIARDPDERMWEKHRRAAYFSDRYIREIRRLCEMIALSTHPPPSGFFGWWRAFWVARRTRRALRRGTHRDWTAVIVAWRQLNDVDAVLSEIFGEKYTPLLRDRTDPPSPTPDSKRPTSPTAAASGRAREPAHTAARRPIPDDKKKT